jgi:hypothetical protein
MKKIIAILFCSIALLQGCSKGDQSTAPASLNDAASPAQAKKAVEEKKAAAAPKANKSLPIEEYQELNSGKQLLFTYVGISTMPVDYEKIATTISNEYRGQSDEFKKRDILNALKPGVEKEIAKAKEGRYFFMDLDGKIDKYDFNTKSFTITELNDSASYRYFYDLSEYRLSLINSANFSKLAISDENQARSIEGLRSKYQGLKTRVYFFAADTKLGETTVLGEITKVRVLDGKGNLLIEI